MIPHLGEITALLASVCYSIGPTFHTLAGKQIRAATVNRVRLLFAMLLLMVPHLLTQGTLFPHGVPGENWFFLALSGLLSLVIADTLLFGAFAAIGTRLSMLVLCLNPVFGSLMAWFLLDETLTIVQIAGITITIFGIAWVLLERNNGSKLDLDWRVHARGLALAFGSAFFHAAGAIASKKGLGSDLPAISGHMIRTLVALVLIMLPMLSFRRRSAALTELRGDPQAMKFLLGGAIFGPLLGMWLNLASLQHTNVGVTTALISLPPIWLLFIGRYFFKERIGVRAVLGSLIVIVGVGVMFVL